MRKFLIIPALGALVVGGALTAATVQAQSTPAHVAPAMNHNSIQPETTLSISATADVKVEPDIAFISGGVVSEARTAEEALQMNANDMAGVFEALEEAGVDRINIQTSNFSLNPRYEYPNNQPRKLIGYTASNQVTAKITDLDEVGNIIDAMVSMGGNTFSGVRFAVEDTSDLMDEARKMAMQDAIDRADLYAEVSGYDVARIVTISESGSYSPQPQPQMAMMRMEAADAATQIAGGELSYSATVNVVFEFAR